MSIETTVVKPRKTAVDVFRESTLSRVNQGLLDIGRIVYLESIYPEFEVDVYQKGLIIGIAIGDKCGNPYFTSLLSEEEQKDATISYQVLVLESAYDHKDTGELEHDYEGEKPNLVFWAKEAILDSSEFLDSLG